ncbi:hypothetical protein [Chimaeribacter coloradensis]|nr:hypothetical protein [Chimaeribacter coloradensis]
MDLFSVMDKNCVRRRLLRPLPHTMQKPMVIEMDKSVTLVKV